MNFYFQILIYKKVDVFIAMKIILKLRIQRYQKAYKCSFSNIDLKTFSGGGPPDPLSLGVFQTPPPPEGARLNSCRWIQRNRYTTTHYSYSYNIYITLLVIHPCGLHLLRIQLYIRGYKIDRIGSDTQ